MDNEKTIEASLEESIKHAMAVHIETLFNKGHYGEPAPIVNILESAAKAAFNERLGKVDFDETLIKGVFTEAIKKALQEECNFRELITKEVLIEGIKEALEDGPFSINVGGQAHED